MKILLKILAGFALVVLVLVLVAFLLPRRYAIERSVHINAAPAVVVDQVVLLPAWKNWSAWHERDPGMKLAFSSQNTGVGAWASWESKKEGNGKMTITEQTGTSMTYRLEFPDDGFETIGHLAVKPDAGGTRLVWSTTGDLGMNPVSRWFGLFLDKLIGRDFERSLNNLKKLVEK